MRMWRYMLLGGVGAGKTSLLNALQDNAVVARKTQMVEFRGMGVDTPGEYSETRHYLHHLQITATEAGLIVVVQDATRERSNFPPNYFRMFRQAVIGVVTKMDLPEADAARSERILRSIGVQDEIFFVSAVTGLGIHPLKLFLAERSKQWQTQAVERRSV